MTGLHYTFQNPVLLQNALTHSSYANENGIPNNERLEFLGDSVLGFLAAEYLYQNYPDKPEGDLTRMRAGHVCEQSLAEAARRLDIGASLRLGKGESATGGNRRDSLLADAFEAVLGAMYLDGGVEPCRRLVREVVMSTPATIISSDAKTRLQEIIQTGGKPTPEYHLLEESGPAHERVFTVEVIVDGKSAGKGVGKSKKQAEQAAAKAAIEQIADNR